jgi:hypothetical protein
MNEEKKEVVGRNEPCPCGSGKKFKRCCGVDAAPKLFTPDPAGKVGPSGLDQNALSNLASQMDQQKMMQLAQAFQRLPKGQLQRFQSLMQKAMSGKDISREAAELEASLPPGFQEMIQGLNIPGMMSGMAPGDGASAALAGSVPSIEGAPAEMSEEEARAIVAQAAQSGKISEDEAQKLLESPSTKESGGFSKFWKKLSGNKAQ